MVFRTDGPKLQQYFKIEWENCICQHFTWKNRYLLNKLEHLDTWPWAMHRWPAVNQQLQTFLDLLCTHGSVAQHMHREDDMSWIHLMHPMSWERLICLFVHKQNNWRDCCCYAIVQDCRNQQGSRQLAVIYWNTVELVSWFKEKKKLDSTYCFLN